MRTQSPLPNALDAHEAQQRQRRAERIVVITGALGLGVAAFALLWPGPADGPSVITPLHPVVAPVSSPSPTPVSALEPGVVTDAGVMEVVATAPLVALPHEEQATDFAAVAKDAIERGEPEVALEALRKLVYTTPPTARVLLDVGRLAAQVGHYALAEQALLDAGALEPQSAEIALERGRVLLDAGELEEARIAARLAIRLDGESPRAWNLAGRVALAQSQWDRAELAFRQAVERDPTDPMLHNNLGLLYVHMRKAELAIDALETARELYGDETPAFVHNNLGLAYEQAQRLPEAREAFADALTVLPDYARAQLNLRRVVLLEAREDEAAAQAERTAELTPELVQPATEAPSEDGPHDDQPE
jgi:tetratricopeptide (TPR) repeat protein